MSVVGASPQAQAQDAPEDAPPNATAEAFVSPLTHAAYSVLRGPGTREKWMVGPSGARYASVESVLAAELAGLPPLLRRTAPELWPQVSDPESFPRNVDVVFLLAEQPLYEIAARERAHLAVDLETLATDTRAVTARVADEVRWIIGDNPADGTVQRLLELEQDRMTPTERDLVSSANRAASERVRAFRRRVFEAAAERGEESQEPLLQLLRETPGTRVYGQGIVLNCIAASLPTARIAPILEQFPSVARVAPLEVGSTDLDTSTGSIGASGFTGQGYAGSGIRVAVLDTGVASTHPALSARMVANAVYLSTAYANRGSNGWNDNQNSTGDLQGHGTHVAGIVGSTNSTYSGVATSTGIINAKCGWRDTNGNGRLYTSDVFDAVDWAIGTANADVLNLSAGFSGNDGTSDIAYFFDAAVYDLLVHAAVSNGNSGPNASTVGSPADAFNVAGVGNYSDGGSTNPSNDSLASSSSRGPTGDGRRKPDLSAPGTSIVSCNNGWSGSSPDFVSKSGTSMAAPHVAGAFALLLDYSSAWLSWPEATRALLQNSTRNTSPFPVSPNDSWGTGGLNLSAAFTQRAYVKTNSDIETGGPTDVYYTGSLAAGDRLTLAWNRHVTSNGTSAPASSGRYASADLDLEIWDADNNEYVTGSASYLNTHEQVRLTSAVTNAIVRVTLYGSLPTGVTTEYFGLATPSGVANTVRQPAVIDVTLEAPDTVTGGASFDVSAVVDNLGDLPAHETEVLLTVPNGFSLTSGDNPGLLSPVAGRERGQHTWTLTAPAGAGFFEFAADATGVSIEDDLADSTTAPIGVDGSAPRNPSLTIENGVTYVRDADVTLQLSATDDHSGVARMRLRNDSGAYGDWQTYETERAWSLTAGDGPKTVGAQFEDALGQSDAGSSAADAVVLDTTMPTGSLVINGGAPYTNSPSVQLGITSNDVLSGVPEMRLRNGGANWEGGWIPTVATRSWGVGLVEGVRTVEAQFRDGAGNESAVVSADVHIDTIRPFGTISLLGTERGYLLPDTPWRVQLGVGDEPGGSGVSAYHYRLASNQPFSAWRSVGDTSVVAFENTTVFESVTIDVQVRDAAGNVSATMSDSVYHVPPGVPEAVRTQKLSGSFERESEVEAAYLTLLAGEYLTVKPAGKSPVEFDLISPSGERVVTGSFPAIGTSKKPPKAQIRKYTAAESGRYTLVILRTATAPAGPVSYRVKVLLKTTKRGWKFKDTPLPNGDHAETTFEAGDGFVLSAALSGPLDSARVPELVGPDDSTVQLDPAVLKWSRNARKLKIAPTPLAQGTGTYTLRIPLLEESAVRSKLLVKRPK